MKISAPVAVVFFVAIIQLSSTLSIGPKVEKKKVVCYFGSWSVYRFGAGKFDVEDIDPFICTHVIFGFAGLGDNNTIVSLDPENDFSENGGKGALLRFTGLKNLNPELKTLLAIGGWSEGSEKYSKMVSDPKEREKFTSSVVEYLLEYNFDGLDFDWEYPANRGGISTDVENFISMLSELKDAFKPHNLLLTAAVAAGKSVIDIAYDIPAMSRILDQIHLMGYDYHGSWETVTGHHSVLYANPEIDLGENIYLNQDFSVNYWIENGAEPSKLILGMGLYGKGFTLNDPANNGCYAEADQPISSGPYTREPGVWGYNEICRKFNQEPWTVIVDPYYLAPYAYKGEQWIGYDDSNSLKIKAQYAVSKGLGGAMVWSIDTDDFRGHCFENPFILIKSIYETMNGPIVYPSSNPQINSITSG